MPMYEYRCEACGKLTDILVPRPGADPKDARCEHCGSTKLQRVVSTVAVRSGSGPCADPSSCPTGTCPFAQS
jgi:putative FmdB family regulatory protein